VLEQYLLEQQATTDTYVVVTSHLCSDDHCQPRARTRSSDGQCDLCCGSNGQMRVGCCISACRQSSSRTIYIYTLMGGSCGGCGRW
jgi:hypothetical protein